MYENIPQELKSYPQWVRFDSNKRPLNPYTGQLASVISPNTWGTFEAAAASSFGIGIGFVFTDSDPYAGIDLDVREGEEPTAEQLAIFSEFDSYAEYSPSGRGVHIIVRGKVPAGKQKGNIEIYSSGRFFTMTGNVVPPNDVSK